MNTKTHEILKHLTTIANQTGEPVEGNCYTIHATSIAPTELYTKQQNLSKFSNNCSKILEIGFNAGHSAAIFLSSNIYTKLVCVDIGYHAYVKPCYDYLKSLFGDRITLIIMNSKALTLKLNNSYYRSFDGVHIDGKHDEYFYAFDTISSLRYMRDKALFIMDDTHNSYINSWCDLLLNTNLFQESSIIFNDTMLYKHRIFQFSRPNYAICSKNNQLYEHCIRSKYDYVNLYNYTLITNDEFSVESLGNKWLKIYQLREYLKHHDYLFWIDEDIFIKNHNICLDTFFLFLPKQYSGLISLNQDTINLSMMLLKNSITMKLVLNSLDTMSNVTQDECRPLSEIINLNIFPTLFSNLQSNMWISDNIEECVFSSKCISNDKFEYGIYELPFDKFIYAFR